MISTTIADRYARAIYAVAKEQSQTVEAYRQLRVVADCIDNNEQLSNLIMGKSIVAKQKKELVTKIFAEELSPFVLNFLYVLLDKGREKHLSDIISLCHDYIEEDAGRISAELISAKPLDITHEQALSLALGKSLNKQVMFSKGIDQDLIAGCVIKVGDEIIDGSVKNQLKMLKKELSK